MPNCTLIDLRKLRNHTMTDPIAGIEEIVVGYIRTKSFSLSGKPVMDFCPFQTQKRADDPIAIWMNPDETCRTGAAA